MRNRNKKRKEALVMNVTGTKPMEAYYAPNLTGAENSSELDGQNALFNDEVVDFLDLSEEAQEHLWGNKIADIQSERAEQDGEGDGPADETRRLTRLLVTATTQLEVQDVLSQAHNNKVELLMAAAQGDDKAKAILRKLDKLIRRGYRKMRDLGQEMQMLQKQQRAERRNQEQMARKIRDELKRAQLERKQRERKYLRDRDDDDEEDGAHIPGPSHAATEAKIMALAQAMASLSSDTGVSADASFSDSSAAFFGGGGGDIIGGGGEAAVGGEVVSEL